MSFTSPLKECRCGTDGIVIKIKVALVARDGAAVAGCWFALGKKERNTQWSGTQYGVWSLTLLVLSLTKSR